MPATTSVVRPSRLVATNIGPSRRPPDRPSGAASTAGSASGAGAGRRQDAFETAPASTGRGSAAATVEGAAPLATLDPTVLGYTPSNAYVCGELAALAYELPGHPEIVRGQARARGFTDVTVFDHGGTQAFLAARGDALVIALAGTNIKELRDVIQDAKLAQDPFLDAQGVEVGQVHRGFRQALEQIWPDLLKELRRRMREVPGRAILVTGHSLGAATATLATARLHEEGLPPRATYLYGSPRVGDRKFCQWLDARATTLYQHQNQNDIVTRAPSAFDWEPVGALRQRYLCGDGTVKIGADWFDKVVDRLQGRWASLTRNVASLGNPEDHLRYTDGLADHEMAEYLKKLQVQLGAVPSRRGAAARA